MPTISQNVAYRRRKCYYAGYAGRTMNADEFNTGAVRTESPTTITWDVRPFGDKQGEAVDSYLHQRLMMLQMNAGGFGPRLVVLLCDSTANIPSSATTWLAELNAKGVATQLRRV